MLYLRFCFGPDVCTGNFSFKICGVVSWGGGIRNNNLTSHTPHFLKISLKVFSSNHSQFTSEILAASLSRTETEKTLLSAVPFYRLAPSFPLYLLREGMESLYIFPSSKEE